MNIKFSVSEIVKFYSLGKFTVIISQCTTGNVIFPIFKDVRVGGKKLKTTDLEV